MNTQQRGFSAWLKLFYQVICGAISGHVNKVTRDRAAVKELHACIWRKRNYIVCTTYMYTTYTAVTSVTIRVAYIVCNLGSRYGSWTTDSIVIIHAVESLAQTH